MSFHPLRPTRTIRDPIHGPIRLTETEMALVDHPLFRRLHRIRQNGLLYYVFPSATHSRFEHSLGTLYVADAMVQALFRNSLIAAGKPPPAVVGIARAEPGQSIDLGDLDAEQKQELFRVTRLAALAHDLGHGPFSHHFDPFAPSVEELKSICRSESYLGYLLPVLRELEDSKRVSHELMSCLFFAYVWNELGQAEQDAQSVAAVILRKPELCRRDPLLSQLIPLMQDVVASAPADADRMDYLERDTRSLGVSYGLFDRERLLKSFLAYLDDEGVFRLGIKRSGARAVENLIQARFELFVQVYYHKTNRAIQLMLKAIARTVESSADRYIRWSSLDSLLEMYLAFSDERFLEILRGRDSDWPVDSPEVNLVAEAVYGRQLWKRIFDGSPSELGAARHALGKMDAPLLEDRIDPKATKDLDTGARLLMRGEDGVYRHMPRQWKTESPIIRALADEEGKISRIYLKSSDQELAKKLRVALWTAGVEGE